MNNRLLSILFLLTSICLSCKPSSVLLAQDNSEQIYGYIFWKSDVRVVTKDKLDNVYLIDEVNTISKFNNKLKLKYQYSNDRLGDAQYIDVTNPLQLLIYYPDFQVIKILDANMAETGSFDLTALDLIDVEAIGMSNDNQVWIYDEVNARLLKIKRDGSVTAESDRMDMLFYGVKLRPTQIIERNNIVLLFDPDHGLYVFDNFGQFSHQIDNLKSGHIQFIKNQLLHIADGNIDIWDIDLRINKRMEEGAHDNNSKNLLFMSNKRIMQIDNNLYLSK